MELFPLHESSLYNMYVWILSQSAPAGEGYVETSTCSFVAGDGCYLVDRQVLTQAVLVNRDCILVVHWPLLYGPLTRGNSFDRFVLAICSSDDSVSLMLFVEILHRQYETEEDLVRCDRSTFERG